MRNLILIICCVLFSSCWQYDLKSRRAVMTDSLMAHFPEPSIAFMPVESTWSEKMNDSLYHPYDINPSIVIYVYKHYNTKKIKKLIQRYKEESIYTSMSEDTTYLTIDDGDYLKRRYKNNLYNTYLDHTDPLIFKYRRTFKFYDSQTLCNLEPGWTICVLKSGSEFILPNEKKYDFNTLPPSYQHGYSSGVAFNENEHKRYLICWAVAW